MSSVVERQPAGLGALVVAGDAVLIEQRSRRRLRSLRGREQARSLRFEAAARAPLHPASRSA